MPIILRLHSFWEQDSCNMMASEPNTENKNQQPTQNDILTSRGKKRTPSQGIQTKKSVLTSDEKPQEGRNTEEIPAKETEDK